MYDVFILFCLLILLLSFTFTIYVFYNYFKLIKHDCYKLHFNKTLYNVTFLLVVVVCFLLSILQMLVTETYSVLPYSTLFLIFFINRIIDFVLLYSDEKLLIKNKIIDISSIEKVHYKNIVFNKGNLLILLYNNSSINIVVSKRTKSFLDNILQTNKIL
jgi:hypothetical protein